MVQADHITHRPHQLDVHIVVKVAHRIAPAFEFFRVRGGDTHHIGQLVHGFLALPQLGFQLIDAFQRFRNGSAGLVPALPRMVVQVFQFLFLVADSGKGFFVGNDLDVHAGIDRERKLLLLVIENLGRREIQFPDHIRDREISAVHLTAVMRNMQIPPVFFQQTARRFDKVIPLNQSFTFEFFLRQMKFIVLIGCTRTAIKVFQQIAEIVFIQPPHLETARNLAFQQLFHLLIPQDFIVRHGREITHQVMIYVP